MRHKENHKQPLELKCNMCIYTNKNEAQLNEHKESHKDKEKLKCDKGNFAEEDQRLMQKHKESHRHACGRGRLQGRLRPPGQKR